MVRTAHIYPSIIHLHCIIIVKLVINVITAYTYNYIMKMAVCTQEVIINSLSFNSGGAINKTPSVRHLGSVHRLENFPCNFSILCYSYGIKC